MSARDHAVCSMEVEEEKPRLGSPESFRRAFDSEQNPKGPCDACGSKNHPCLLLCLISQACAQRFLNMIYYSLNNLQGRLSYYFSDDFSDAFQGYQPICPSNSKTGTLPPTVHIRYIKFFRTIIKYAEKQCFSDADFPQLETSKEVFKKSRIVYVSEAVIKDSKLVFSGKVWICLTNFPSNKAMLQT